MHLRGILLCLKEDDGANVRLLFNRCFPTSELKASQLHEKYYIPFTDFVNDLSGTMTRLAADSKKLFLLKDHVPHEMTDGEQHLGIFFSEQYKPVYALRMADDRKMWPVVMLEQGDILAVAVPLVETMGDPAAVPLHKIDAVAPAYELLVSILEFVTQNAQNTVTLSQQRLKDLTVALTVCCPFGLITSTDLGRLRRILKASIMPGAELLPAELDTDAKMAPSFRPVFPADKESVSALLVERISCIQTSETMMTNVSGCCWLCAELTSANPNITFPVILPAGEESSIQLFVSPHSTIEKPAKPSGSPGQQPSTVVLSVVPPNDWFPLFMYEARQSPEPPVFGLLNVQGSVAPFKLTLQLQSSSKVQNIELTDLTAAIALPTPLCISPARTPGSEPLNATHGEVAVDSSNAEQHRILWRLGNTKLPVEEKPATLKGSLSLSSEIDPAALKDLINDLHATLRFSWRGAQTASGLSMRLADAKVLPSRLRPRFALECRVESVTFRIYNSA